MIRDNNTAQARQTCQKSEAESTEKLANAEALIRPISRFYLDRESLPVDKLRRDTRSINSVKDQLRSVAIDSNEIRKRSPLMQKAATLYLNAAVLLSYLEGAAKGSHAGNGREAVIEAAHDPVLGGVIQAEILTHGSELLFIGG